MAIINSQGGSGRSWNAAHILATSTGVAEISNMAGACELVSVSIAVSQKLSTKHALIQDY